MSGATLAELRARFDRGELPRDEYWRAAQRLCVAERERTAVPPGGPVAGIQRDNGGLVMVLRDGTRLAWDPADLRTAPNMLLFHGEYEPREAAVLEAYARPGDVVLDVGANVGWYTLLFARRVGPRGRVHAFEPVPRTFQVLARNVELNAAGDRVTLVLEGLAERDGDAEFYLPAGTGSVAASRQRLFADQDNERVRVRLTTLDAYAAPLTRLDLLKADVEGGELPLLQGGMATLRRFRPVLFLELLRKWSRLHGYHPNDVIQLLRAEGYACHAVGPRGLDPMVAMDESCEATNFVFRHETARDELRRLVP